MTIHGFDLVRETLITELKTRARLFRHAKTGTELLSLENDDENKVFGITFRTPISDSTGVPHIMEHSVLCGSRKYRVKEPFIELAKGSLKTFLNAFTYPDRTCYPVASTNLADFYNLMDVYLDAVFYPTIAPEHLQQEGWHYEVHGPDDPLTFKGVVFNEMKGAYSSPDRIVHEYARQSIFPDTTYRYSSGGDPKHIPDLTYDQFKRYHETFYHPSNALIYFYGDDDPAERLRRVDVYLRDFERREVDAAVTLQSRFDQPRRSVHSYAVGPDTDLRKKSMVLVNWLIGETIDPEVSLAYDVLDHVLTGTPASPLRKALIDSGLGEEVIGGGLNDGLRQAYFSIGLKGVAADDVDRVEDLVLRTLGELSQNGIDRETVRASLNTIEFRLREYNTGQMPRGLSLMLRSLSSWLYGGDPIAPLCFEAPLAAVKEQIATDERYLENLINRLFRENAHRTTIILHPDPKLATEEEEAEKTRLAQVRAAMSPEQIQELIALNQRLKLRQETPDSPEALATIPRLRLEDLDRQEKPIPREILERAGTTILYHDLFTNGIVYLDVGFDLRVLPRELLPYVPLFARALLELGTEREDFVRLTQRIGRSTGGIYPDIHLSTTHDRSQTAAWLFLRGKAMLSQADELLAILRDIVLTTRLDNRERFRQMVLEQKARREASLVPNGSGVVSARLGAHFSQAGWAGEQLHGTSNLFFVRQIAQTVDDDWPRVQATLERIRQLLVNRAGTICNVTLDSAGWQSFAPRLEEFLGGLPVASAEAADWRPEPLPAFEALVAPGKVNYVGKAARLYDVGYRYDGSTEVVTRFLSRTWLWDQIRVKGGAYGISGRLNHRSGVFAFVSYRDPNLLDTLSVYDQSARFLREVSLDQGELTKAIIGTISDIDPYLLPDAKGRVSLDRYLAREPDDFRQRLRDEVLGTTVADFRAFADVLDAVKDRGHVVVLGSHAAVESANRERPGFLQVTDLGL